MRLVYRERMEDFEEDNRRGWRLETVAAVAGTVLVAAAAVVEAGTIVKG